MKAKFAGKCATTGKSYPAGTEIVKGAKGWEIAGGASSASPSAKSAAPDFRYIHNARTGKIEKHNVSQIQFCSCCKERPGFDKDDLSTYADCRYQRSAARLTCSACGNVIRILTEQEEWNERILPELHFTDEAELSHKVGPAMWDKVARYFEYFSFSDLADMHDEMDNFSVAAEYESRGRGGQWTLKNNDDISVVEDILGILPQNRRAALDVTEAEQAAQEKAAYESASRERMERETARGLLFAPADGAYLDADGQPFQRGAKQVCLPVGERVKWESGFSIYGGGIEFLLEDSGEYVWSLCNNGADGDDWSRNNTSAGIGRRYPATPARIAFLERLEPGLQEQIAQRKQGQADFAALTAGLTKTSIVPPNTYVLTSAERLEWTPLPGQPQPGPHDSDYKIAQSTKVDGVTVLKHQGHFFAPESLITKWVRAAWTEMISGYESGATAARHLLLALDGEAGGGPYLLEVAQRLVDLDGLAHYEQIAARTEWLIENSHTQETNASCAQHHHLPYAVMERLEFRPEGASYTSHKDELDGMAALGYESEGLSELLGVKGGYPHLYRHPDGRLFAGWGQAMDNIHWHDLSGITPGDVQAAGQRQQERKAREKEEAKIAHIRKVTKRPSVMRVAEKTILAQKTSGGSRSGSEDEIQRLTLEHQDGEHQDGRHETVFLVVSTWWAMGEDGDADTTYQSFDTEAAAREAYNQ